MPELLEVFQPGVYPWWILWFAIIPIIAGLGFAILDEEGGWFGLGVIVAVIFTLVTMFIGISVQGDNDDLATQKALTEVGFDEVDYDGVDEFDAVWGGERVKGLLVSSGREGDTVTYQIVIVPPVSK